MFLCELVKARFKFLSLCSYIDLMKLTTSARTMLFSEAVTRQVSRLLWNAAASWILMSPASASGHLRAQWQILKQFAGLCPQTKLQLCVSLLYQQSTACNFNPPQIYIQRQGKSFTLMINQQHSQGGFFIASDLNSSCPCPCTPLRHQNLFGLPYPNLTPLPHSNREVPACSPMATCRKPSIFKLFYLRVF